MNILNSSVLGLIAGILCSIVDLTEQSTEDSVKDSLKQMCEKNGAGTEMEYVKFENSPVTFDNCLRQSNSNPVMKRYCHKVLYIKICLEDFKNAVTPCLEPVDRDSVEILHKIADSILEFGCDNPKFIEDDARKEHCEENGTSTENECLKFMNSPIIFDNCVGSMMDPNLFLSEMNSAQSQGILKAVMKRYCDKVPSIKICLKVWKEGLTSCMDMVERNSVEILHKIVDFILKFGCDNQDSMEDFFAGGGPACLAANYSQIQLLQCAGDTFTSSKPVRIKLTDLAALPFLNFDESGCRDLDKFLRCSVGVMESNRTSPKPAEGLDDLRSNHWSSCDALHNSSPVFSARLINVVSMIAAMLTYSQFA